MPLADFSSRVISVFEVWGLHIACSNWNCLPDRFIFKFASWRHTLVGHASVYICEKLYLNNLSPTFVRLTIVILTWDNYTLYSIVLPIYIYARVFHALIIYFRYIFTYVTTLIVYTGFVIIEIRPYFLYYSVCFTICILLLWFVTNVLWGHCMCVGCNTVSVMWRQIV